VFLSLCFCPSFGRSILCVLASRCVSEYTQSLFAFFYFDYLPHPLLLDAHLPCFIPLVLGHSLLSPIAHLGVLTLSSYTRSHHAHRRRSVSFHLFPSPRSISFPFALRSSPYSFAQSRTPTLIHFTPLRTGYLPDGSFLVGLAGGDSDGVDGFVWFNLVGVHASFILFYFFHFTRAYPHDSSFPVVF
jgi:hypothetical protein